jgi:monothiol glutaredoxin
MERIQALVDAHPVLLFMKGTQLFPQCGFSNTAVQILNTFRLEFHSVDVLADDSIRQGIKDFSQWPTIPQLYVAGEFIGGCDM